MVLEANFEITLNIDPPSKTVSFKPLHFTIGIVIPFLTDYAFIALPDLTISHHKLTMPWIATGLLPVLLYPPGYYHWNQLKIPIKNTCVSIRHGKNLLCPGRDLDVPIDYTKDAQIEYDPTTCTWFLLRLEQYHTAYYSTRSTKSISLFSIAIANSKVFARQHAWRRSRIDHPRKKLHLKRMLQAKTTLRKFIAQKFASQFLD